MNSVDVFNYQNLNHRERNSLDITSQSGRMITHGKTGII